MREFLSRNIILLAIIVPLYLLLGNLNAIFGTVALVMINIVAFSKRNERFLLLHFLLVLLLGDNKLLGWEYFSQLKIVNTVLLFAFILIFLLNGHYTFNRKLLFFLPFILSAFISASLSPIIFTAFLRTISYAIMLCISFIMFKSIIEKEGNAFIKDLVFLSILIFSLGFFFTIIVPASTYSQGRYKGIFGNPNGIGLFSVVIFPFLIWSFREKIFKQNAPIYIAGILLIFSLLLSNSRNGMASIMIFMFFYLLINSHKNIKISFFSIILPAILLIFLNFSLVEIINGLGLGKFLRVESLLDGSGRTLSWQFALQEIPKNPWLGKGFYYNIYVYREFLPESIQHLRELSSSWNSHLNFLLDTGIIGYFLFFIPLSYMILSFGHEYYRLPLWLTVLFAAVYEAWLSASLNTFTIYFFCFLVLIIISKENPELLIKEQHGPSE